MGLCWYRANARSLCHEQAHLLLSATWLPLLGAGPRNGSVAQLILCPVASPINMAGVATPVAVTCVCQGRVQVWGTETAGVVGHSDISCQFLHVSGLHQCYPQIAVDCLDAMWQAGCQPCWVPAYQQGAVQQLVRGMAETATWVVVPWHQHIPCAWGAPQ